MPRRLPVRSALIPRGSPDGDGPRGPFVLAGTDVEIGSDSVSSEWTSESDSAAAEEDTGTKNTDGVVEKRRRRVRKWRIKHRLTRPSSDSGSDSGSDTSSSTASSGSSSSSEGEVARQKKQRLELLREWKDGRVSSSAASAVASTTAPLHDQPAVAPVAASPEDGEGSRAGALEWFKAGKRYRRFALAQGFLSEEDIKAVQAAAEHENVTEINDRKGYLAFKHRVWRFESQLRGLRPNLYNRLIDLMKQADDECWKRLWRNSKRKQVYPEIEFITYDVAEMGEPCFIEPHVDNKSAVTMVAMLSASSAYEGGSSCFRRSVGRHGHRELRLSAGDIVLFRGEKLSHWITPVTGGRRVILQIELSRV